MSHSHETERLILKKLKKEDASLVLSFYEENKSHFEPWEPLRDNNFYSLSYQRASLTAEHNLMSEGKLIRYWIFLKDNPNEIVGSFCFQNFLREPYRSCCLGYKLSKKYLHKGYALEAIQKGIELLYEGYHIHRIEAYVIPENRPSRRLLKNLGFHSEGISRSYARIHGKWTDHCRYALINPEESE